jgi:hypothetical protein
MAILGSSAILHVLRKNWLGIISPILAVINNEAEG